MLVRFAVQANMLANMEFEFECFFDDSNVKIVEFFFSKWMDILHMLVRQKKLSKQTGPTYLSDLLDSKLANMLSFTKDLKV